jgi:hypothetical protein
MEQELGEVIHVITFIKAPSVSKFSRVLELQYARSIAQVIKKSGPPSEPRKAKGNLTTKDIREFNASLPRLKFNPSVFNRKLHRLRPAFILCSSRSGSTLLRSILAGNSQVFAPPELRLMNYQTLDEWKKDLTGDFSFFQEGLARAVMGAFHMDYEAARAWVDKRARNKTRVERIYDEIQKAVGKAMFIDKTPYYSLDPGVLQKIEHVFDEPLYIHLVRNPSDMKRSFESSHMDQIWMYDQRYTPGQLGELVWHCSNRNILDFFRQVPVERKYTLMFEDLVKAPEETVAEICRFLGIPFDNEMLNVYQDKEKRMTDGAIKGSKMIGDPKFLVHKEISKSVVRSGYLIDADISSPVRSLAQEMGYLTMTKLREQVHLHDSAPSFEEFLDLQKKLFFSWQGVKLRRDSLVAGRHVTGGKVPLFWCFQGHQAFQQMSAFLDRERPIYGMRSGHLLFRKRELIRKLAFQYCNELEEIHPDGPILLGGNCQGGRIVWEMAAELSSRGRKILLLCLMEVFIKEPYDGKLALIYGRESPDHNPFLSDEDPTQSMMELYTDYSVSFIQGAHGQFFNEENIKSLVSIIEAKLLTAESPGTG